MKASSICGSDIRAIYREHLGKGDEAVRDVIAGHEPCGQVSMRSLCPAHSPSAWPARTLPACKPRCLMTAELIQRYMHVLKLFYVGTIGNYFKLFQVGTIGN